LKNYLFKSELNSTIKFSKLKFYSLEMIPGLYKASSSRLSVGKIKNLMEIIKTLFSQAVEPKVYTIFVCFNHYCLSKYFENDY